jgi:DNA-binding MarR family transcriptional regulator
MSKSTSELAAPTLLASCGFLLARLGMESRRRFTRLLAEHELAMHDFSVLLVLGEHGALPQQRLSRMIGIDPRNAVPIIDGLETRLLVERRPDLEDRRRYAVALTAAGRRMMERLGASGARLEARMLEPLSRAEQTTLQALLHRLLTELDDHSSTDRRSTERRPRDGRPTRCRP